MSNPFNLFQRPVKIHFLQNENPKENSHEMWRVYQLCQSHGITVEWIKENDPLNFQPTTSCIVVLSNFEGKFFEKLRMTKCSILGPKVLLHYFLMKNSIPRSMSLVLNTAMSNVIVYLSGFTPDAKLIYQQKIKYMSGFTMTVLYDHVTHFVTDSVISQKYREATRKPVKIYTEKWIDAVWEANLKDYIHADDENFHKYKAPVFMNLVITSTNLRGSEKDEIIKLITENGGEFMGALYPGNVKILITKEYNISSDKMRHAIKKNIPCLSPDWVRESVKSGYALPFTNFFITSAQESKPSPPKKGLKLSQANVNIPFINCNQTESSSTYMNVHKRLVVDNSNKEENKENEPHLIGCNIYSTGFPSAEQEKINTMINKARATRCDKLSDRPTHVIIGDAGKASGDLKIIQAKGLPSHIVNIQWLEQSINLKKPAPVEAFAINKQSNSVKRPLSTRSTLTENLQMLKKPMRPQIFRGLTFLITALGEQASSTSVNDAISSFGGKVLFENPLEIPDFAIVPSNGANLKIKSQEIVTSLFIEDCVRQKAKVDIQYYHRPFHAPETAKPLKDCVIMFDPSYSGFERIYLSKLAMALGARDQDTFAQKDNVDKLRCGGTHLISKLSKSDEYSATVKWKLPAVTGEWLRACAEEFRLVDETPFLVAPEWENLPGQVREEVTLKTTMNSDKINETGESPKSPQLIREFKFMIGGFQCPEKYKGMIRKWGGEMWEPKYDDSVTHFVCSDISMVDLCYIAGGKWILHASYLAACEKADGFVDKEEYEWGNPLNKRLVPLNEKMIASAAHKWRLERENSGRGVFQGMVAMLMVKGEDYNGLEELIRAGRGTVVQANYPYDSSISGKKITHCFVDVKAGEIMDWAMLANRGILCFEEGFLKTLLITGEPVNIYEHVVKEFRGYLHLLPS